MVERWWDTTHSFHIADKEMIVTPHDFHHMTGLRSDGAFINLEGELGTQLGIYLLGRRYTTETICYFDVEVHYRPFPQVTANDYARMARAFLRYLLRAYLFTNGRQTVSLRWLAFFYEFERAQDANWG